MVVLMRFYFLFFLFPGNQPEAPSSDQTPAAEGANEATAPDVEVRQFTGRIT